MDFNEYSKSNNGGANGKKTAKDYGLDPTLFNLVTSIAGKYDGKNQTELLKAIYEEAKRGKARGTLSNADIDNFVAMLSPMLDDKKRKVLFKIADELKNI